MFAQFFLFFRRNLNRALTILEMIKRREKTKREHVHLGIEIFEKRYQARDFNGHLVAEFTTSAVKSSRYYTSIQNGPTMLLLQNNFNLNPSLFLVLQTCICANLS